MKRGLSRENIEEDLFYLMDAFTNEGWSFKIIKEELVIEPGGNIFKWGPTAILVEKNSKLQFPEIVASFVVKSESSKDALIDAVHTADKIRDELENIQEAKDAIRKIIENAKKYNPKKEAAVE